MKYTGAVIAESLIDEAFLNFVNITERRDGKIIFTVNDDFVSAVAEEISKALTARGHVSIENEYEQFMVYPNKVFRFPAKDEAARVKALEYAKSLGI